MLFYGGTRLTRATGTPEEKPCCRRSTTAGTPEEESRGRRAATAERTTRCLQLGEGVPRPPRDRRRASEPRTPPRPRRARPNASTAPRSAATTDAAEQPALRAQLFSAQRQRPLARRTRGQSQF